jgi:hypothetical protein
VNTAKVRIGRLLEVRVAAGFRGAADVDALFASIDRELEAFGSGQQHVTVADWRLCPLMSPEAAERFTHHLAHNNARTERSAALAYQDAPVAVLQFMRVIREARLPDRKLFFSEDALIRWVNGRLAPAEQRRVRDFLAEGRPPVAPSP